MKDHRLTTIVKLPDKIFTGVTASVFVFEAGKPQNGQNIIGYYIEEDGLETVKNQGRQDIRNRWSAIEDYWIQAIHDGEDSKYNTRQIINPSEHLSYQMPEKPFEVFQYELYPDRNAATCGNYLVNEEYQQLGYGAIGDLFIFFYGV